MFINILTKIVVFLMRLNKKTLVTMLALSMLSSAGLIAHEVKEASKARSGEDLNASKEAEKRFEELEKFVQEFNWQEAIKLMNGHVSDLRSEDLEPRIAGFMEGKGGGMTCVQNGEVVVSTDPSKLNTKVDGDLNTKRVTALTKSGGKRARLTRTESVTDPDTSKQQEVEMSDHLVGKKALLGDDAANIKDHMYCVITTTKN
jgi:hypothetical protein